MFTRSGRPPQPRSHRRARRIAAAILALLIPATIATPAPASAHTVAATSSVSIPVGGLTYRSGAGSETWQLRAHAAWSTRVIKHRYAVRTVYGYRSSSGDHGRHLGADFMIYRNSTKGYRIASFAKKHHKELNISYVIWNQRIWSVQRSREGWRRMSDRGGRTANHKDHVHVSYCSTPNNFTYRR